MTYQKFISKDDINQLPPLVFDGEIILVTTTHDAKKALLDLRDEKVLGFDTETRPAFTKGESYPPALLQLGTREKAYLFRLQDFKWPEELIHLLENEEVLKVGVAIKDDAKALHRIHPFTPRGFVDVSYEARIRQIESEGLRALAGIFLGKRLSKASKITNWNRKELTEAQLQYAATDAVVSFLVYEKIVQIPV
jgi:ribonuclease D